MAGLIELTLCFIHPETDGDVCVDSMVAGGCWTQSDATSLLVWIISSCLFWGQLGDLSRGVLSCSFVGLVVPESIEVMPAVSLFWTQAVASAAHSLGLSSEVSSHLCIIRVGLRLAWTGPFCTTMVACTDYCVDDIIMIVLGVVRRPEQGKVVMLLGRPGSSRVYGSGSCCVFILGLGSCTSSSVCSNNCWLISLIFMHIIIMIVFRIFIIMYFQSGADIGLYRLVCTTRGWGYS